MDKEQNCNALVDSLVVDEKALASAERMSLGIAAKLSKDDDDCDCVDCD